VPIGDAANGLCGGMAYAVRDLFEADMPPPDITDPPPAGSPWFQYLVRRLLDSFDLPRGPLQYLELMNPGLSDGDSFLSWLGIVPHGRAWRMVRLEWPRIKADIDGGRLSPLGLVRVKSLNPFDLGKNHQVLAYAYDVSAGELTLSLYDPNWPRRDDVQMSLSMSHPRRATPVNYSPGDGSVFAFFRTEYRQAAPPLDQT
jgi:hypothetical protein